MYASAVSDSGYAGADVGFDRKMPTIINMLYLIVTNNTHT